MESNFLILVQAAKGKYSNLRTYFVKEHKKVTSTRSGAGAAEVYKSVWPQYESLLFLAPTVTLRQTESTISIAVSIYLQIR